MEKRIEIHKNGCIAIINAKDVNLIRKEKQSGYYEVCVGTVGGVWRIGENLKSSENAEADREVCQLIKDVDNFIYNDAFTKEKMVIDIGEFKTLKEKPYVIVSLVVAEGLESPYKISDENVDVVLSNTTTHFNVKISYDEDNYLDDDEAIEEAKEKLRGYIGERAYFEAMDLSRFHANYDVSYVRVSYE